MNPKKTWTNYEKQVADALEREARSALIASLKKALRGTTWFHGRFLDGDPIAKMLPELCGLKRNAKRQIVVGTETFQLIRQIVRDFCDSAGPGRAERIAEEVVRKLAGDRAMMLDLQCQMPPPRKERKRRGPALTKVEQRARQVEKRLKNWQRKQALAKTKIAALKKKAAYYKKKGQA